MRTVHLITLLAVLLVFACTSTQAAPLTGLDLGSQWSVLALRTPGKMEVIGNEQGDRRTPTLVAINPRENSRAFCDGAEKIVCPIEYIVSSGFQFLMLCSSADGQTMLSLMLPSYLVRSLATKKFSRYSHNSLLAVYSY